MCGACETGIATNKHGNGPFGCPFATEMRNHRLEAIAIRLEAIPITWVTSCFNVMQELFP